MRHPRQSITVVLLPLLCLFLVAAREIPSVEQMRGMVTDKQFKRVLREVARAMQLKGDEATAYDRGQLLLIRADAQLGMRIEPQAAKSFRDAAEAATRADDRATARAMSLLMSKSERLIYKPHTGEPGGREIDIGADRQAALDALLADEMAAVEPRVRSTKEKKEIAALLEMAAALEPVAAVERAATGTTTRTDEIKGGLITAMETLLDDALIELDRKAVAIELNALGLIAVPQAAQPGQPPPQTIRAKKRGLSLGDEAVLKQVMETCGEVVSRHREVAMQLGAEPDRFRRAGDFAIRLSSKAGAILRADYTGIVERSADALPPAPTGEQTTIITTPPPPQPDQPTE